MGKEERKEELLLFLAIEGVPAKVLANIAGVSKEWVYYRRKINQKRKKRLYPPIAEILSKELLTQS